MKRKQSGYILLQAMVVIAGLLSLVAILAADNQTAGQEVQTRLDERRADEAAYAAVQRAMSVLGGTNTNPNIVTLNDDWALQGTNGDDLFTFTNNSETYRMQIIDAGALVNINAAAGASSVTPAVPGITATTSPWLQLLPLQQDQIDSLLDWVGNPTTAALSDGAKNSFYNALPTPYDTPMGLSPNGTTTAGLTTVDELLLIDNWTAQTLYQPATQVNQSSGSTSGPPGSTSSAALPTDTDGNVLPLASLLTVDSGSPNTTAAGTARTSIRNAFLPGLTGAVLNRARASTSYQALFNSAPQLRNPTTETNLLNTISFLPAVTAAAATATPQRIIGRVNVNTAPLAVLQMIPGVGSSIASTIQAQQTTGFQSLGALATSGGLTPAQVADVADYFTIGSDTWIVRAYGSCGKVNTAVEAVVRVTNVSGQGDTAQVINWQKLNTTGIPAWWDWNTQSTSTIDAGAAE